MSLVSSSALFFFFFFNDTATTEIYTLSLHDALPISPGAAFRAALRSASLRMTPSPASKRTMFRPVSPRCWRFVRSSARSEEHTSELQSQSNLVCRLLLEKKKHTEHVSIYGNV